MPLTVFVTGYDRFALQAFEADAIDYLLKPFGDSRYELTMDRIKRRLAEVRSLQVGRAATEAGVSTHQRALIVQTRVINSADAGRRVQPARVHRVDDHAGAQRVVLQTV